MLKLKSVKTDKEKRDFANLAKPRFFVELVYE